MEAAIFVVVVSVTFVEVSEVEGPRIFVVLNKSHPLWSAWETCAVVLSLSLYEFLVT